jgi:tripartite-type tricarboxylate transporter receptor subunit TctC
MKSRFSLSRFALCFAALTAATAASAAGYPDKPITFVVPYTPGGATDAVARIIGHKLSERLGQLVIVDNRPGAGGNIGSASVAKAPADGYTMLLATTANAINESLYTKLPFDTRKSFTPVTQLVALPNVLIVNSSVPATSVKELIALAKAKPGQLNYASAGMGSSTHLAAELFKSMAQVDIVHVVYKGSSPALADLRGGQVHMMFDNMPSALPQLDGGKLRALAVTGTKRSLSLPNVPTVAESGLPGYETVAWHGVVLPAGAPKEVVTRLHDEIVKVLAMPDVKERLRVLGIEPVGSTPEQFDAHIRSEITKWAKVVKASGARVD